MRDVLCCVVFEGGVEVQVQVKVQVKVQVDGVLGLYGVWSMRAYWGLRGEESVVGVGNEGIGWYEFVWVFSFWVGFWGGVFRGRVSGCTSVDDYL